MRRRSWAAGTAGGVAAVDAHDVPETHGEMPVSIHGYSLSLGCGCSWRMQDSNLRGETQPVYSRPQSAALAIRLAESR